jgi:DNA-binding transcriptional ArsR family regulator
MDSREMSLMDTNQLDSVFAALANPTRRALLRRLAEGDASVAQLAEPFRMSQPAVSKHLKVLDAAGLIVQSHVATSTVNSLRAQPMREATEYLQSYRKFWGSNFDRLDAALAAYQQGDDQEERKSVHD